MIRRLRGIADRAGRAGRAIWVNRAGKATRCDTNSIERFFQSIHYHQ